MKTNDLKLKQRKAGTAVIQFINGASALLGGYMLMKDPSGLEIGLKTEYLAQTPFQNFLIPGIVLFVFNGLGNMTGFTITLANKKRAGEIAMIFGAIMMIWIMSQVAWIGYKNYLQPLYFSTGLIQFIFGYYLYKVLKTRK